MPGLLLMPTVVTPAAAPAAVPAVAGVVEGAAAFAPVLDQQLGEAVQPGKISLPALLSSLIQRLSPLVVVDNHPGQSPAEAAAGGGDNPGGDGQPSLLGRVMQFLAQNGLAASPQEAAPLLQDLTVPQIEKLAAILDVPAAALEEALAQLETLSPAEVLEVIAEAMTGDSESVEATVEEIAAEAETEEDSKKESPQEASLVVSVAPAELIVVATPAPKEITVAIAPLSVTIAPEEETKNPIPVVATPETTPETIPAAAVVVVAPATPVENSVTPEVPVEAVTPFAPRRALPQPLAEAVNENVPQAEPSAVIKVQPEAIISPSPLPVITEEAIVPIPVASSPVLADSEPEAGEIFAPGTPRSTPVAPEILKPKNTPSRSANAADTDAPAPVIAAEIAPVTSGETATGEVTPELSDLAVEAPRTVASLREALSPARAEAPRFAPPRPEIQVPVVEQVLLRIRSTPGQKDKHYEIHLDPADLGRVDVRMEVDGAGRTQISVIADKRETLEMLQRDRVSLEKSLNDLGLKADAGSMQFNLREQGKGQSFADMQQQQQNGGNGWRGEVVPEELREEITPAQPYRGMILSLDEGINIRV